ncbi:MAG: CehA/McbA family metallohydrolase [Planctomycetota bacterium]
MSLFSAFAAPGEWFRGNCHTHTTLSDGKDDPPTTVALYRKRRYDFLVLTDHHAVCEETERLSTEKFLVIRGVEMHPPARCGGMEHHLIALGVRTAPEGECLKTAGAAIRWAREQGALVYYCHPYWSGHSAGHLAEGRDALGVEVFNSTCRAQRGLGYSEVHWDYMLSVGWRWRGIAVDDMHNHRKDGFCGWIMVKAERLDQSSILGAMEKGWFYSTQGPTIRNLTMNDGIITLDCSPVKEIVWHANGPFGGRTVAAPRALIEHTRFEPKSPQATYLRIMIRDAKGRQAWSNPIWRNPNTEQWEE